jgi:hypothetical protein
MNRPGYSSLSKVEQIEAKLGGLQQQKKEEGNEIPIILASYFISIYIES